MSGYCAIADVYSWIPRGSVKSSRRLLSSVSASTEVLTLDGHGLATDDAVTFAAEAGGTLPSPLVAGTTYYSIRLSDSTFSVTTAAGGSAINLTTEGENVALVCDAPWDLWIAKSSAIIDEKLLAHVVPLTAPYPQIVVDYTAGMVAECALAWGDIASTGISERMKLVRADFERWVTKGAPIRGAIVPRASNLAVRSSAEAADPRGWARRGNTRLP